MTKKYLTIASKIDEELLEISKLVDRAMKAWDLAGSKKDNLYLDSVSLNLYGFYSGIEKIFEIIARNIDGNVPTGDSCSVMILGG